MSLLDKTYTSFVNLDHRTDRLNRMLASLDAANVPAVRTPGMLPKTALTHIGGSTRVQKMLQRTPGAIGCHYSQVRVMEEALHRDKHAFVMEDDLIFCSDFHQRIAHIEGFIQKYPWDILWMGGTFHVNPPWWHKKLGRDAETTDDPRMVRTYGAFCTYAYIVNKVSIAKVLERLDAIVHLSIGIDWAMIQLQPQLYTFAYVPGCITQYDNQSDIGKGMTYFSGFKKLGPYWFQDKLTDFDPTTFNWAEAKVKK